MTNNTEDFPRYDRNVLGACDFDDKVPFSPPQASTDYASHVWSLTLCREKIYTIKTLKANVARTFELRRNAGVKFNHNAVDCFDQWAATVDYDIVKLEEELKKLIENTCELKYAHHLACPASGYLRDPLFFVDITESDARLELQKSFDIEREASAISTPFMTTEQFYGFHTKIGGRFYEGAEWLPESLTARSEYESLKLLTKEELQYRQWINPKFAAKLGVRPNGVPLNEPEWQMVQALKGYVRVEDHLSEDPFYGSDSSDEQQEGYHHPEGDAQSGDGHEDGSEGGAALALALAPTTDDDGKSDQEGFAPAIHEESLWNASVKQEQVVQDALSQTAVAEDAICERMFMADISNQEAVTHETLGCHTITHEAAIEDTVFVTPGPTEQAIFDDTATVNKNEETALILWEAPPAYNQ